MRGEWEGSTVGRGELCWNMDPLPPLGGKGTESHPPDRRSPDHVASVCVHSDAWLLPIRRVYLCVEFCCVHSELQCAQEPCSHGRDHGI